MTGTPKSQRRTLLKAAGALTGMGALGRMVVAQNTSDNQTTYSTSTVETSNPTNTTNGGNGNGGGRKKRHIILGARVGHWLGLAPREIEGSRNPTLGFVPTERYTVTWINLDGKKHEFQILGQKNGENGQVLYRTGSSSNQGETRTLTFKPTDRIRRYRCRFHPDSMRGEINRSGQFGGGGGTFTTGTSGGTNTNTNQGTYNTNTNQGTYNTNTNRGTYTTNTNRGTYTTGTSGTYNRHTTGTYNTYTTETNNTRTTRTRRR